MDNQMWWNNQQPPIQHTPEQLEEINLAQLSQIVEQDNVHIQQVFQQYQAQANMYAFYGMMNTVDPSIWHINHLFGFKHFLQGYNELEIFLLSQGLIRFSQYLNVIKADVNKALAIYGVPADGTPAMAAMPSVQGATPPLNPAPAATMPSTPAPSIGGNSNYMQESFKIQKDAADYNAKIMKETYENTQETNKRMNDMWSKYLKS